MNKWLIIPIEIKAREFESRLLISLLAAKEGFNIVIGSQTQVWTNLDFFPVGIFFEKSISKIRFNRLKRLTSKGFKLACIDEEGLSSLSNEKIYINQRLSKETLELTDKMFTWGDSEKEVIVKHLPDFAHKIFSTGNVRVDLWDRIYNNLYHEEVKELNEKYGKYLLFPSSFGVNHAVSDDFIIKQAYHIGIIKSKKEEKTYINTIDLHRNVFEKYIQLICAVASEFPDIICIVRPHPSERHDYWETKTKKYKNIKVIYQGNIGPWILGSIGVIHSSCTTGIEAFLMGKPVISYLPQTDKDSVNHISNDVSMKCRTVQEVIDLIKQGSYSNSDINKNRAALKQHLTNIDGAPAYQEIVSELLKIEAPRNNEIDFSIPFSSKISSFIRNIKKALKRSGEAQYNKQKFRGLSISEVLNLTEKFQRILPELKESNFEITKTIDDLFVIKHK